MAIDKPLSPILNSGLENNASTVIDVKVDTIEANPEIEVSMTDEGGVIVDFDPSANTDEVDFNANLSDFISEDDLEELSNELISAYQGDKESRKDWEDTYIKGLDQLGLKIDERTEPWVGACGVFHPMLTEAVVRFQAQAISEIFPPAGPVKTEIVGELTSDKTKQAHRVQNYMNYLLTNKMVEYRNETEKLLWSLPLAGSAFRKVYYDVTMGRPCSMFVPAEDFIVSYGTSDLITCERSTHVMKKTENDVRKMQVKGFYRDIDLPTPSPDIDEIVKKYNELTGDSEYDTDSRHTLLEMQVDLDLVDYEDTGLTGEPTGIALPYVVTIDLSSKTVLSIYRNWYEDDEEKMKRQHFVHYQYLPGVGFYGFGLIHVIGGLAKSATSLLRQLVDAGTLSNLPGGLKSRGLRIKGDDSPIMPGEFRDVDVPGGAIKDNIAFLPYKEPSQVLYSLLENIVDEGRRFASLTDMKINDMNQEAPVGTTLAIMERTMKVMSAIQQRLHASMKIEFKILSNIIKDFTDPSYPYEVKEGQEIKKEDFDNRVDVIPVSNPNAATMGQRIMQYQAALQLSQQAPQMYNMQELHRQMLDVLGIQDTAKIIPTDDEIKPLDPVAENMNMMNGEPVKAFEYQDHESHITVHIAASEDPEMRKRAEESPMGNSILASLDAHVTEHLAFLYRKQIEEELGTRLPPLGEALPEHIEKQLSTLVAEASQRLLSRHKKEQEEERIQEELQDPLVQAKTRELDIKEADVQRKAQTDLMRQEATTKRELRRDQLEVERIKSQEKIAGAKLGADIMETLTEAQLAEKEISAKQQAKGAEVGMKIADKLMNKDKPNINN
tara:strand:+ start:2861 stop:5365 length:2505 start_codon:yes stop_codon:yes gene_type:complete